MCRRTRHTRRSLLRLQDNYQGQITFFAWEVYEDLCRQFGVKDESPGLFRRKAVTRGLNLNALIGQEFEFQGVTFAGVAECKPCYWMNQAFAPGTESRDARAGRFACKDTDQRMA